MRTRTDWSTFFTCLNLKDAFFSIHLALQSQPIFAYQWESSSTGEKGQLTWTLLPQGFNNSSTIFETVLASDLKDFSADQHGCILLQYVHDHLLAGPTQEAYMEGIHLLFSLLWKTGYKVSQKKAQICQDAIKYLRFHCREDNVDWALRGNRLSIPFWPPRPANRLENL
jgi:hypothetical protein